MNWRSRCASAAIEGIAGFAEGIETVGVEHFGPQVHVVAGRVARAGEQVLEVRQPVVQADRRRQADALELSRSNATMSGPSADVSACAAMSTNADAV